MLHLEATASIYDGVLTLCAGIGLLSTPFMVGTVLEPLAPVEDSVVVLILCSLAILSYFRAFGTGVAQLAGFLASARDQIAVRYALKRSIKNSGGRIVDGALVRIGRKLDAMVMTIYMPTTPVTPESAGYRIVLGNLARAAKAAAGASIVLLCRSLPQPKSRYGGGIRKWCLQHA